VKDDVDPGDRAATHLDFAQITAQQFDLAGQTREIRFVPGTEIVHGPHIVPDSNEPLSEVRTDKAGGPRHQAF